jgi:hypothetical protein
MRGRRSAIVPSPRRATIHRILGEPFTLLSCAPETAIAEKGVTILERGITSTRWRDNVDIVALARNGIDPNELSARPGPSPATATSPSNAHHTSPFTTKSHKRSGPHGARKTSNLPAMRSSTTKSPWSCVASTRSSARVPNKRIRFGWFSAMSVGTGHILEPTALCRAALRPKLLPPMKSDSH